MIIQSKSNNYNSEIGVYNLDSNNLLSFLTRHMYMGRNIIIYTWGKKELIKEKIKGEKILECRYFTTVDVKWDTKLNHMKILWCVCMYICRERERGR